MIAQAKAASCWYCVWLLQRLTIARCQALANTNLSERQLYCIIVLTHPREYAKVRKECMAMAVGGQHT